MFGKNSKRQITVEEFDCSPKIEGPAYVVFGVLTAVMFLGTMTVKGTPQIIAAAIIIAVVAALIIYGIYLWRFRKKPLRRSVVLGNRFHDFYLRSKWLFLLVESVLGVVLTAGATLLVSLPDIIRGETSGPADWFGRHGIIIFAYAVYHITQEYLSYYAYYKSEQYAATKAASGSTTHNP